jgi:hypothetical protein
MTFKAKVLTLSLLAGALGVSLILGLFFSYRGSERRSVQPLSARLGTGTIGEIVLSGDTGTVTLRAADRTGDKAGNRIWSIILEGRPFPAEQGKINRLFEIIDQANLSPALTENEENWALFELGDDASRRISLGGADRRTEIILGKEGEAGRGEYIRFAGDSRVYLLSQSLAYYSGRDAAYWSDLRLFPGLKGSDIVAISAAGELTLPAGRAELNYRIYKETRQEGLVWFAPESERKLDQGKADSLAVTLSQLNGRAFAAGTQTSAAGLDSPDLRIVLTAADQKLYEIRVGAAGEPGTWYCGASVNGETPPSVYFLDSYTIERITKPLEDLFAAP